MKVGILSVRALSVRASAREPIKWQVFRVLIEYWLEMVDLWQLLYGLWIEKCFAGTGSVFALIG